MAGEKKVRIIEEPIEGIKSRTILWYLTFFGFAINYVVRINQSIAIVDMIDLNYRKSGNKTDVISECIIANNISSFSENKSVMSGIEDKEERFTSLERKLLDFYGFEYERNGFKWDTHQSNIVMGSFYWLHWVTQIPGGILASKYGTKFVFGWGNYIAVLLCFVTPLATYFDYRLLVAFRIITGASTGLTWPAMHQLVGKWIPGNERSRFVTAYLGSSIGVAVFYPLFGFIIKISCWEWVFHASFLIGTIWFILWQYFVFDSPEEHPRIESSEKNYILKVLGSSVVQKSQKKLPIPWGAILTSKCVWMGTICQVGGLWSLFTLVTQLPQYFRVIHGASVEMIGIISGVPHLLRTAFSMMVSMVGDYLLTNNKMSRNNVRRMATVFHLVLNGVFCFALAYAGCNVSLSVIFITISLAFHGAVSTGVLASMIDNSPNFSGIILGITSTVSIPTGFISPIVVGYLTYENQTVEAWQHIFEISGAIMIVCGLIFICFNDASLQEFNKPPKKYLAVQNDDANLIFTETVLKPKENEFEKKM